MRKWKLWGGLAAGVLLLGVLVLLAPHVSRALARMPGEAGEPPPPGPLQVDETRAFTAAGKVTVSVVAGRLEVLGWERPEIAVTGSLADGSESVLRFETGDDLARVAVEAREHRGLKALFSSGDGGSAELTVHVPRGSSLEVETVNARLKVEDVDGAVRVQDAAGPVTVSGTPARFEMHGASSEVSFEGRCSEIHAKTVSGGVILRSPEVAVLGVETVSGPVSFRGSLADGAEVDVKTVSGNVDLTLPPSVSAQFYLQTRGAIESELGPAPQPAGPSQVLQFVHGAGGSRVDVDSAGGILRIRTGTG